MSSPPLRAAEPCNRDWDDKSANCYFYAKGKLWKGVSGLYYGGDPDYRPVFLCHGPAGGGAVSDWALWPTAMARLTGALASLMANRAPQAVHPRSLPHVSPAMFASALPGW